MRHWVERLQPSLRSLLRHKRFSALAVFSLGVAVGLNTTMYSVLDALLYPKTEMREPENLFRVAYYGDMKQRIPPEAKVAAIEATGLFAGLARRTWSVGNNYVERGSRIRSASMVSVSANYFAFVGNQPLAGRLLSAADEPTEPRSVVMGERLWRQLFPERERFDTATVVVNGQPRLVVGLLSSRSDFPRMSTDLWQLARATDPNFMSLGSNVVRLRPGVTIDQAYSQMQHVARRFADMTGESYRDVAFRVEPMMGELPFRYLRFNIALVGAVGFVLLIACFNLANLQLARGISRTREFATRAAVGATRRDIMALLLGESAWLAGTGLALGGVLTVWGMQLVKTSMPPTLSTFFVDPQVSWRLVAFAAVLGILSLGVIGLLPAIKLSRVDINELLKSGAGSGMKRRTRQQYGALVVLQVGLALALCGGAGLLIRAAASLYEMDINPQLERIVSGYVRVTPTSVADRRSVAAISNELVVRMRAIEGVQDAATIVRRGPAHKMVSVDDDGGHVREIPVPLGWGYSVISPSYLRTYGIKLLKGRDFTEGEFAEQLAIVDDRTARFLWPGADPLGRMIKLGSDSRRDQGWVRVVGVTQYLNVWASFTRANQEERLAPALGMVYVLNGADTARLAGDTSQSRSALISVAVRGTTDIQRLPVTLRSALHDPGRGILVGDTRQLASALALDALRDRQNFVAALFTTFALIALAVAALGVYAVVSHSVSQRAREIGLRLALGATDGDIRQRILFQGNVMALGGIAVGLILARGTAGYLTAFLRGWDDIHVAVTFGVTALVLFAVTLLASWVPARRAMRINPVEALRND